MLASSTAQAHRSRSLDIKDAIETTRAMTDGEGRAVFLSPDRNAYVAMLIRGDLAANRVRMDLLSGGLSSLQAAKPHLVAQFGATGLGETSDERGGSDQLTWPTLNPPTWMDGKRVAFFWEGEAQTRQVVTVDIDTATVRFVTHHSTDVLQYQIAPRDTIVYSAAVDCHRHESGNQQMGTVVTAVDAFELLGRCNTLDIRNSELFVSTGGQVRQIRVEGGDTVSHHPSIVPKPVISTDGRFAVYSHTIAETEIPNEWSRYKYAHLQHILQERALNPLGSYARQLQKLFVVDVAEAKARPLWNAPSNSRTWVRIAWSPDDRSILVGPTFTPLDGRSSEDGESAFGIAEVDVQTGEYRLVPVAREVVARLRELHWKTASEIEIRDADGRASTYFKRSGQWLLSSAPSRAPPVTRGPATAPIRVELRQGLNTPPALYGIDTSRKREVLLYDLNPQLRTEYDLGKTEWVERPTAEGLWTGRLYYPVKYTRGKRYPLVVQTHSFAPKNEFSLYGRGGGQPALGPGGSAYIAQALAGRGIMVLHGQVTAQNEALSLLARTQAEMRALEQVVDSLVTAGTVDRNRVGLMGHSASGWLVNYTITHSSFPYAAALTDDNKDGTYLQAALSDWRFGLGEEMIGAPPFGAGMNEWLKHSPSFNVEHVNAPLLLTLSSPGLELSAWELFSRLRFLKKPVEYFLIPNIDHGSHGLQNPQQIFALQQRALDWWRYWLKDEEDTSPEQEALYTRWKFLRSQRDAGLQAEPSGSRSH